MAKLTFYRQKRIDGGIRTGIELNDDPIVSRFDEGRGAPDPALLWYIDVRCEGRAIPSNPDDAADWLLQHAAVFKQALESAASKFAAGIDGNAWPMLIPITGLPAGARGVIACSSMKRVTGRELSKLFEALAAAWKRLIRRLSPEKAAHA